MKFVINTRFGYVCEFKDDGLGFYGDFYVMDPDRSKAIVYPSEDAAQAVVKRIPSGIQPVVEQIDGEPV